MIVENQNLKNFNSFGVDCKSKYFATLSSVDSLNEYVNWATENKMPILTIGNGSNILFTQDFDGLVLKNEIDFINKIIESENDILVKVGAGTNWDRFVEYAVDNNLYGIENLSLIPGTVGAAPIQNIGAYGVQVGDVIDSVEYFDIDSRKISVIKKEHCEFSYRSSIFKKELKNKAIITAVFFILKNKVEKFNLEYPALKSCFKPGEVINLKELRKKIICIRSSKLPDPRILGNAGSFFKNPVIKKEHFESLLKEFSDIVFLKVNDDEVKIPAAWLIEKSSWKGVQVGEVATYHNQALVIVNKGKASGKDIINFANKIELDVFEKFKIKLEREVNVF